MSVLGQVCRYPIRQVIIYKGHEKTPLLGPYLESITKRIQMFNALNRYREESRRPPWKVIACTGEEIVDVLKSFSFKETLLVIPAGQSGNLDKAFSVEQTSFLQNEFFANGGRGYFNCGSAYWTSAKRIYNDQQSTIAKISSLPLFDGIAEGPLCPHPGKQYNVGFITDAVRVTDGKESCTIYLSGGGSFFPAHNGQKIKIVVKYPISELLRCKIPLDECKARENAAIVVSVGEGAALLSMFHSYYGPSDIDVELYEKQFPDCGTDWRYIKERLSSLDERMRFVLNSMLIPLEDAF